MKRCTVCGETKPLDEFPLDHRKAGRHVARCKACKSAYDREAYKRWRDADPERARAKSAAGTRRFRETNPDYPMAYYWANVERERERARLQMKGYRATKPEEERARKQRYRKANAALVQEREREKTYARRALTQSSPETARYMTQMLTNPCVYCGAADNITVDHIVPLSRGGKHEPANLAPACFSCNASKCALLLEEWPGRNRAIQRHGEPVVP